MYIRNTLVTLAIMGASCLWTVFQPVSVDLNVLQCFFEIFGVVYAIIVGFAMLIVSDNYSLFKQRLHAEIDDLQDLRDYLMYVDNQDGVVKEIRANIKKYVELVLEKEWPEMTGKGEVEMDTPEEMYAIMRGINKIRRTNESDGVALEKLISTVASITTHRMERLHAGREKLPPPLRYLILILSAIILFAFSLIPVTYLAASILLGSLLTLSIVLIVFVIFDIADPFRGVWRIGPDQFDDLRKRL